MNVVLLGIAGYILAQFAIGIYVSRRIATEADYLVAGRSLGPVVATFTVFATWFGAETCIAAAGAVYERGLSGGSADPFGYALCVILTGLLFAIPLWRLKLTTIADLFRIRYDKSVERLAVLLIVPTSLFWAAAQVRAFGQVISSASGAELELTITFAAVVVVAYTMFGGLLADAWTDLVQGLALIVGLVALSFVVLRTEGLEPFAGLTAAELNPLGSEPRPLLEIAEEWAIPVVGSMVAAELVARILASRSGAVARNATVVAGMSYLLVGLMPVGLGLAGAALLPGLTEPEQVLPQLAQHYLPTALYVLFAGGLVSAILSTVDSALLMAGGLVSHNIIVQRRPDLTERAKVRVARGAVCLFGIIAYVMAIRAERVYDLVEEASAFGSSGMVIVVCFGLFTRVGGRASALTAMVVGVVSWIVGAHVAAWSYPYLTSLVAATAAYLTVAALGSAATKALEPLEA